MALGCPHQGITSNLLVPVGFTPTLMLMQNHYDPKQTYRDPNRTYHDVARTLAQYPSVGPRTDVYSEFLRGSQ